MNTYSVYDQVPWYRRSSVNTMLIIGSFLFGPLILITCFVSLTGDIYYNKSEGAGNLKVWHWTNKIIAFVILTLNTTLFLVF